jgi:UPF0271 protein
MMDINCDLGEGMPNEEKLMALIDSCSIACGGHFGDQDSMTRTLMLSKKMNVKAGAHPSFEDKVNFGRKVLNVPLSDLKQQIIRQIESLYEISKSVGVKLHHVKAHGALYNEAAHSLDIGNVLIDSVLCFKQDLCIFVPYGSNLHKLVRKRGIKHWAEVFADRNYSKGLELVSRDKINAIVSDPIEVKQRVKLMLEEKSIIVEDGSKISINFDTICVHGDHPRALEFLKELKALKQSKF